MFNSIKGVITQKMPKQLFIEANGIEWDITIPDSNLDMIGNVGDEARIYTYLQHAENLMCLYGFASSAERDVFLNLLKVDGVGPKGAVKILSSVKSSELAAILDEEDVGKLEKIPGVGKKTAGKMLLSLRNKLSLEEIPTAKPKSSSEWNDLITALVNMGYDKNLVEECIANLLQDIDPSLSKSQKEEQLFKKALVELAL